MRRRDSLFTSDIGTEMYDDRHQLNNPGKQEGETYNIMTNSIQECIKIDFELGEQCL